MVRHVLERLRVASFVRLSSRHSVRRYWLFDGQKRSDAGLIAVVTPQTLAQGKQIHSIMTGAVHTWEARPGEMLQQIAEVEFPQMLRYYRTAIEYQEPKEGDKPLIVELLVQHYNF